MISERITEVEPAEAPTRYEVAKCLEGCINYRVRMANSVSGQPEPSLREKMATELMRAWDEIERLQDIQSQMVEELEDKRGA